MNKNITTAALLIDTFNRDLKIYAVSITEVGDGVVLRYGATVGELHEINSIRQLELALLIPTKGYSARTSGGVVDVINRMGLRGPEENLPKKKVVGWQGMPFNRNKSLRSLREEMEVFVLAPGASIEELQTHSNAEHCHLNEYTARAASEGVRIRALLYVENIYILEGDLNSTRAWEIDTPRLEESKLQFNPEHRSDIFSIGEGE